LSFSSRFLKNTEGRENIFETLDLEAILSYRTLNKDRNSHLKALFSCPQTKVIRVELSEAGLSPTSEERFEQIALTHSPDIILASFDGVHLKELSSFFSLYSSLFNTPVIYGNPICSEDDLKLALSYQLDSFIIDTKAVDEFMLQYLIEQARDYFVEPILKVESPADMKKALATDASQLYIDSNLNSEVLSFCEESLKALSEPKKVGAIWMYELCDELEVGLGGTLP
jgi:hypothetical protein